MDPHVKHTVQKKSRPRSIKQKVNGITFDSKTEARFYQYLKRNRNILSIECQPKYQIIEPFEIECPDCLGLGTFVNAKTGRTNKCRSCKGKGQKRKAGATYTADFKATYQGGRTKVYDVKGYSSSRDFPLRKLLFERLTGHELIVIREKEGQWIRD